MPFDNLLFYNDEPESWFIGDGTNSVLAVMKDTNLVHISLVDELVASGDHSGLLVIGVTSSITLLGFNYGNVNLISDIGNLNITSSQASDFWLQNNRVEHVSLVKNFGIEVSIDTLTADLSMVGNRNTVATIYHGEDTEVALRGGSGNTILSYEMDGATFTVTNVANSYIITDSGDATYNIRLNTVAPKVGINVTVEDGDGDATMHIGGKVGSKGLYSGGDGSDYFDFTSAGESTVSGGADRDVFVVNNGSVTITDYTKQDILILGTGMEKHLESNHDGTWTVTIVHSDDTLLF